MARPEQTMPVLLDHPVAKETWQDVIGLRNGVAPTGTNAVDPRTRDAGPWEPAVKKIISFQRLGNDWDGLGAIAPSKELLESAVGLACVLCDNQVDPPHCVIAGINGTVTFEWHDPDGTYTEIEISRPLFAEVMVIEPGRPARHWTLPNE